MNEDRARSDARQAVHSVRRAQAERDNARRLAVDKANALARAATPAGQAEAAVNRIFGTPVLPAVAGAESEIVAMVSGLSI